MPNPRFNKVMRDLWLNFGKSLLIILSISVGVAVIGVGIGAQQTLSREIPARYAAISPSSASLITESFEEEIVEIARKVPGVASAQARFLLNTRLQKPDGFWQSIQLVVYPDYENIQVNKVFPVSGAWPPPSRQVLIEQGSLALTGSQPGDSLTLQLPDGTIRSLPVAGLVHDISQPAGVFSNQVSGYINADTLEWFGYAQEYNEILLTTSLSTAGETPDLQAIQRLAGQVRSRIEKNGTTVLWTTVQDPTQHWFQPYLLPIISILDALGALALILSCFLVVNTITALLAQQTRQIGMMKAIGGRMGQIVAIFASLISMYGLLALALAIPLGNWGTGLCLQIIAGYINFDPPAYQVTSQTMLTQAALCLLVPLLAAMMPIFSGTRIPVRAALSYVGVAVPSAKGADRSESRADRFNLLPHPLLLSLRNIFRRKARLSLTLLTLTIGSAIFMAVQNVQASLLQTLDETLRYYNFDVVVFFDRPLRIEQIKAAALQVPAIKAAETWGAADAHRVRRDESESDSILFAGPPLNTQMIRPILIEGRWLLPEDENAVVINTDLLRMEPDLRVGDTLTLKVSGKESRWTVVGIVKSVLMGPWAYANQPYYAQKLGQTGQASAVYLTTWQNDEASLLQAGKQIEQHFEQEMLHFNAINTVLALKQATTLQFQVLTGFLMVMALLIAFVGGLGLTGSLSLNIIERSREIGIMRAVGARNSAIHAMVMIEGVLIGGLSWLLGGLLSYPLGGLLGSIIGEGFLQAPLDNVFSPFGAVLWLVIILVFSAIASLAPAYQATRFPIREVLAHE